MSQQIAALQELRAASLDAPLNSELRTSAADLRELYEWIVARLESGDPPLSEDEIRGAIALGTALSQLPAALLEAVGSQSLEDSCGRLIQRLNEGLVRELRPRTMAARWLMELGRSVDGLSLLQSLVDALEFSPSADPERNVDLLDAWLTVAQLEQHLARYSECRARLAAAESFLKAIRGPERLAYFTQFLEGERLLLALADGRQDRAVEHFKRITEAAAIYASPELIRRNHQLEVRLLAGTGTQDELREKLAALARAGVRDAGIELEAALQGIKLALAGRAPMEPAVQALRLAFVRAPQGRPRLHALIGLVLAEERLGQGQAARAALSTFQEATTQLLAQGDPRPQMWRGIGEALAAILDLRAGAERERLLARRDALYQQLARWRDEEVGRSRESGTGLFYYQEERYLPAALVELELVLDPLGGPALALNHLLQLQDLHELARAERAPACTLEDLRRDLLPAGHGILLYHATPSTLGESLVFAFDAALVRCARIGNTWDWEERQARLASAFRVPASGGVSREAEALAQRVAQEIGNAMLPPEVASLAASWSHWTIVGADAYGELSWDGLVLEGRGVLGLEYNLAHVPSLAWALHRAKQRSSDFVVPLQSLFLCAPDAASLDSSANVGVLGAGGLQAQAWEELLREDWNHLFSEAAVATFLGQEAQLSRLRTLHANTYAVLSILAHGTYDSVSMGPAIRLTTNAQGEEDLLRPDDLADLPAARVVLLGSCGAATGVTLRGNAAMSHFAGRWLARGAESVLGGVSDLAARPTSKLLAGVHRRLLRGEPLAEALRNERQQLVVAGYSLPGYYALLKAYGLAHIGLPISATGPGENKASSPPQFGEESSKLWVLVPLSLVVIACALWTRRAKRPYA